MKRNPFDNFPPFQLLHDACDVGYIGEPVSQLSHALQCAQAAQDDRTSPELVAAALLHDIGHLCAAPEAQHMGDLGVVAHEWVGARYLANHGLSADVCALVVGHVAAKRYLVTTDLHYLDRLSSASLATLELQGGPMSAAEVLRFEAEPLHREMLRLRTYDEQAKAPFAQVASLGSYLPLIEQLRKR